MIKVNGGDAEESNYLFPSHLLDKLQEETTDKVDNFAMNKKTLIEHEVRDNLYSY